MYTCMNPLSPQLLGCSPFSSKNFGCPPETTTTPRPTHKNEWSLRLHVCENKKYCNVNRLTKCRSNSTVIFNLKNLILNLQEETVRRLAIRVLSRGVGSLEFIQSQLIPEGDDDSGPMINRHGSPLRPLTARLPGNRSSVTLEVDSHPPTVNPEVEPEPDPPPSPHRPRQQTAPIPEWCKCGHCRQMPKDIKNICCKKKECVTSTQRFYKLCLDPDILQLCVLNRAEIRNDPIDNSTHQFRKAAYRQYILDKYGYLGRGNRKVVPSCAVWKVRGKYPSLTGVYMGFKSF